MGLEVFKNIPADAPLIVAEAVWQYSHHVLAGLRAHCGPILTVANFEPDWPGLVGLLGLNGGMTKMNIDYSTICSVDFTDEWFKEGIHSWVETGTIKHDASHLCPLPQLSDSAENTLGVALADQLLADKAIIGVFDEGCMGMYNAIIDDELLNPIGIYKERLSQSALWAEMQTVADADADADGQWLLDKGMTFRLGPDETTDLTPTQLRGQYKMYIAALRISDDFGLDAVGIQYQPGRFPRVVGGTGPPYLQRSRRMRRRRRACHQPGLDPATTLHDVRWGEQVGDDFVWVYEISGSVPASHLGGYQNAEGWRQGHVFFSAGGSTINGVSKPGEIVWSRLYIADNVLNLDIGRVSVVELPAEETQRRKQATNPEWPIAHVVLHGVNRDQFMGQHKANHSQIVYAPDAETADKALLAKAALFDRLGVRVHLCGTVNVR